MIAAPSFDRRVRADMAPPPTPLHLVEPGPCDSTPCSLCDGLRIVKGNRDIEASSWWVGARRTVHG